MIVKTDLLWKKIGLLRKKNLITMKAEAFTKKV